MEGMSLLPMIKCSSCGIDIDISQLADHVCATTANVNEPPAPKLDRAATFGGATYDDKSNSNNGALRSGRGPPPLRVDPYAANKPFRIQDSPLSPSPLTPGGRSNFHMNRSATSPLPRIDTALSPSLELKGNMDSPFPFFPTNRINTPTSPKPPQIERPEPSNEQQYAQPGPLFAPLSPRTDGGENVLKRMNTIAPGPFDGQEHDRRPNTSSGPLSPGGHENGHRRTNTQGSGRSAPFSRASMASVTSRGSTLSNGSYGLPSRPKPGVVGAMLPPPPPVPQIPLEEKTEGIDAFLLRLQKETMGPSKVPRSKSPMHQAERPVTPVHQEERSRSPMRTETRSRSPMRRDSMDTVERQLRPDAPRATSRRPPSIQTSHPTSRVNSTPPGGTSNSVVAKNKDLPPLPPVAHFVRDFPTDPLYTPSDSGHSEDSYASSGFRSATSSRSSPPTSEVGHSRQASKISRPDYDEPFQRTLSPDTFTDSRAPPPIQQRGNEYQNSMKPLISQMPITPQDPAIQKGLPYDKPTDESKLPLRDPALNFSPPPRIPDSEPELQPMPRRTCRGCGKQIMGKSVKDSSGRLTGRYHKECFVCRTCRGPFPTAEFYVFQNAPYCHQHYHVLNGSLCRACNRGIEGQYAETDDRLKFHPRCFTCFTCRIVLRDDYYEVGRRPFCERHAYAAVNQRNNAMGGPPQSGQNRNNMQKRRTRMMMMR